MVGFSGEGSCAVLLLLGFGGFFLMVGEEWGAGMIFEERSMRKAGWVVGWLVGWLVNGLGVGAGAGGCYKNML